jgi:uncharacterized protein (DUF2147 family)
VAAPAPAPAAPEHKAAPTVLSPIGRWKTIDDSTGKEKSIVSIWEDGGKYYGRIVELLNPDPKIKEPKCVKCEGELKDKPTVGLRILWDLKADGDEFSGGKVLDPENGKIYKCYIAIQDGGQKLKLRGFIGFSLLGRTQYWKRVSMQP